MASDSPPEQVQLCFKWNGKELSVAMPASSTLLDVKRCLQEQTQVN
jgi:hypothetical protein